MFRVIQSNDTDTLVTHLLQAYATRSSDIFSPFTVIVPSMVLGEWLSNAVAERAGISTLFTAEFWGKYQWTLIKQALDVDAHHHPDDALKVPEVAVLSASIMRWRMFGYFHQVYAELVRHAIDTKTTPSDDDFYPNDALRFLLKPLIDPKGNTLPEHRLWQLCHELASIYVRYLTHRPYWLDQWAQGNSLKGVVEKMMADKARLHQEYIVIPSEDASTDGDTADASASADTDRHGDTPEWLQAHYIAVENALRTVWQTLFGQTYLYRMALERRFWQVLDGERGLVVRDVAALPTLYVFTVQQIPQVELDFLRRYALHADVVLYHFNPSMMFWADIVDRRWLEQQTLIDERSVYLKDYGHGLLSRLGKESRETFAMLAELSGGADAPEAVVWQDDFVAQPTTDVLSALKHDILMLADVGQDTTGQDASQVSNHLKYDLSGMLRWGQAQTPVSEKSRPRTELTISDGADGAVSAPSIAIHACHSLRRQLEIARLMIASYLNEDDSRCLSDIAVLLPDVAAAEDVIRSVFPDGQGADGLSLPIKITGTPDKSIDELLAAIAGFYTLLGEPTGRFYADDVYAWLLNPALYDSFGLDYTQMQRACALLRQAGFRRGFDEWHLARTLAHGDHDYRYSFSYALDRIVLGLLMADERPTAVLYPTRWLGAPAEQSIPLAGVGLDDKPIIDVLCQIHSALRANRHHYGHIDTASRQLNHIEQHVIKRYFAKHHDSMAMRAIFTTMNTMRANLRANTRYQSFTGAQDGHVSDEIRLSLQFVLQSLSDGTKSQAISAEPSQVITFARFGTLRTIPFGLTVMIDMNLSAFPRTDRIGRLDLMRAGLKRRGDRYHEDDDNGAFLDALLCTRERVLIFYQGIASDGKTRLLPAAPVGELIEFLKTQIGWQLHPQHGTQDEQGLMLGQLLPSLIERYLVSYHAPIAFDASIFYEQEDDVADDDDYPLKQALQQLIEHNKKAQHRQLPPPPIWQRVRATLDGVGTAEPAPLVRLMDADKIGKVAQLLNASVRIADEMIAGRASLGALDCHISEGCEQLGITLPKQLNAERLIASFKNPAMSYLQDKIKLIASGDDTSPDEPLTLDGLGSYQLNDALLAQFATGVFDDVGADIDVQAQGALADLYYGNLLPAGVPRWHKPCDELRALCAVLDDYRLAIGAGDVAYSALISLTEQTSVPLRLGTHITIITAALPTSDVVVWQRVMPQTARERHLFGFWVYHLLWQITRANTLQMPPHQAENDQAGHSLWQYHKATQCYKDARLFGLPAIHPLMASALLYNLLILHELMAVAPAVMTPALGLRQCLHDKAQADSSDTLATDVTNLWQTQPYNSKPQDDHYAHHSWQTLLGSAEPDAALTACLPIMRAIYAPLAAHLQPH